MRPFEYLQPENLEEACSLLSRYRGEAKLLAGGHSLLILLKHRLVSPRYIIDLKNLRALEYISNGQGSIRIGALTTHRAIELSPLIKAKLPILAEMEKKVGSVQVRNWGTIGGSLCHADPAGDPEPALIALRAKVKVVSVRGEREIDLEEFFTDYLTTVLESDEILKEIEVPNPAPYTAGVYRKESIRPGDFGIATVAAVVTLDEGQDVVKEARIVLGAVGATPIRAKKAEESIVGSKLESKLADEAGRIAAAEAQPTTDVNGSVEYKREIVKVLTRQVLSQAMKRAGEV